MYYLLLSNEGAWARVMRKILDSRWRPQLSQLRERHNFREIDIFGETISNPALAQIGVILYRRLEAGNLFPAVS